MICLEYMDHLGILQLEILALKERNYYDINEAYEKLYHWMVGPCFTLREDSG